MKLSNTTLAILKNLAAISSGIYVPAGHLIRAKDSKNKVLVQVSVTEEFPEFCVQDLNKFLGVLTIDKEVEVDFQASDVVITFLGGKSKITYRCSPKTLVNVPKDKDYTINDPFVKFTLTKDNFAYVRKTCSLLSLPNVAIENDGEKTFLRVFDPKNDAENQNTLELSDNVEGDGRNFQVILDQEVLNFLDGDYEISANRSAVQFKHKSLDVTYWVAPEMDSTYES
jgi:hypothetical protein